MKQTIEIEIPDGKKAVWKDNKVIFEDIKPQLPKTWDEFCLNNPLKAGESTIYINNSPYDFKIGESRDSNRHRTLLPTYDAAKAHLALMQLHQLRDCYRQGWKPDRESNYYDKYVIVGNSDKYRVFEGNWTSRFLTFQDMETAKEFLANFRDLIEEAGDLI